MLTAIFSRCSNLFGDPYSPAKTGVHVSYTRLGACFYFLAKQSVKMISTVYPPPPPPPRKESDMMSRYTHLLAMVALVFLMASGPAFAQTDYDTDNDNLIDVTTLAQLNAIRYDLNGDGAQGSVSASDWTNYTTAFSSPATGMGCPATCTGYELMNNLDFDENSDGQITVADAAYWNGGAGWTPIGVAANGTATAFTATFDGNDNTISNLFINLSTSTTGGGGYVGLFGDVTGTIRDVGLSNVNITNTRTGASFSRTGALAGRLNSGTVSGSYVAGGSITHNESDRNSVGLVGCLLGYSAGTVSDSYATCNVTGTAIGLGVGGLIGWSAGQVSVSYATGNITGSGINSNLGLGVGGLIGRMEGSSFANYATGNVSGSGTGTAATDAQSLNVGGLMGSIVLGAGEYLRASYATGKVSGSGTGVKAGGLTGRVQVTNANSITAVYAIGAVSNTSTGTTGIGGLAAEQGGSATAMTNSYWDTQTTGQTTTAGTSSSTTGGQTTSALQSITGYTAGSIYADWNLNLDGQSGNDDPWNFGATDQYPVLKYGGLATTTTEQFRLQPAIVTLALTSASISENGGVSTVSATLAHPSSAATTITVRPVAGAYTVGADATITIAAGRTANASDTVVITAVNNTTDAPDNEVSVSATVAGGNGASAPSAVTLTITDDEAAPSVQLTLSPSSISENGGVSTVTATLAHPSSEATTITVSPVTGGYTVGSDATIAIAAGNTTNASDTVVITAVNNGQIDASNRVVTVTGVASNDHGAGSVTGASLTLQDAGGNPTVSISSPSVAEGSSSLEFIVSLSAVGTLQVTVDYADATTGTATSDTDYTAITAGTLTLAAGVTSGTITVSVTSDALDEDDETVVVTLSSATNAVFTGGGSTLTGTGTIRDDDATPTLSIDSPSVTEGDDGETASLEFIVTLNAVSGRQVTVGYTDAGTGTASSGTDYTAITDGTLTFAAGVTSNTLAVTVTGDDTNEPNETVIVTLRNAVNATISTTTGTGTINDNDAPPTLSGLALVAAKIVAAPANPSYKDPAATYTSFSLGFTSLMPQTTSQSVTINNGPPSDGNSSYFHYVCADKDTRQVNPDGRTGCRQIGRLNHPTSITLTRAEVDFGGVMWHVWEGEGEVTVIREWIPIPVPDAPVTLNPTFSAGTTAYTGTIAQNRNSLRVTPTASSAASTISVSLNAGAATTVASASTHTLSSLSSGANTVSVTVTERSGSLPYTVTLSRGNTVPSFTSVATQTFTAGVSSEFQVPAATGGDGVLTYEATGLPAGLTFDADGSGSCTGARTICGTPTAGGTSSVTIYAVDADNDRTPADRGSLSFMINVRGVSISSTNPASLTESDLNGATVTLTLQHAQFSSGVSASHFALVTAIPNVSITSLGSGAGGTTSAVLTLSFSGNFTTAQTLAVRVLAAGSNANSVLTTGTVAVSPSAGVTVSRSSLTLEEDPGGANANRGTYTVVLDAQPASNVVIGVSSNNTDVTLSSTSLTFTNGNWNTAQTVTVTAGQDTDDADDTATVSHSVTTASGDYTTSLSIASVTVTVNDDDMLVRPTNVQVTALVDTLSVSWDAVTNATGYKVQWKSGSEAYNTTDRQASVTGVSHKIPDLTAGTTYTVQVIATRATFDDSEASDSVTGVPKARRPDAPTNVQVTALVDSLEVRWDAVTGATGYKVQWKSGSQAYNTTDRQTSVTGVSHKIPGLTGGTAYTVQVIATRTHADDSEASSEATGTPKPTLSGLALAVTTTKNPPANASYKNPATAYATFSIGFTTLLPQTTAAQPVTITGPASDATNEYFHHVCADRDIRQLNPSGRTGCRQISILTHPTSITLTQAEVDSGGVMWHIYDEGSDVTVMTAWISIPISESVTLTPSFASSIVNYTGNLPSITDSLHITPTASLGTATIEVGINGGAANTVDSGDTHVLSSLNRGANTVSVTVTESSQSTAYTVTLSRGNEVPSFGSGSVSAMTFTSGMGIQAFLVPAATGGDGALTYEASGLPAGLTFDADGSGSCTRARTICGTPTAGGTFPVTIDAIDADDDRTPADRARLSFTIKVAGVSISESSLTLNEDPGGSNANQGTYTVVLDIQPSSNVVIGVSSSNTDVTLSHSSLTFTNGNWNSPQTVTVTANPDTDGLNDTATVTHRVTTASGSYRIGLSIASVSVTVNDDDEPALSIGSPSVAEGSGSSSLEFIVTLSIASSEQVTVDYADATTGTATSGTDYTAITGGTLTLAAGVTRDTIAVPVTDDALDEDDETVIVTLRNASNATISMASGTGTITDDDDPPTLSIDSPRVDESDDTETASLEFIVSLSAASGKVVTVGYADSGSGSATSGTDYTTITGGTLTLAAGVTRDTIAVTVTGDDTNEPNETVVVTLSSPTNATISTASGTGTITDDDDEPSLSIADASVTEGATGTTPSLEFIVTLSAASGKVVTVGYADAGTGSASSGTDYTALDSGTLTFAAGVTRDTIAVSVTGDDTNEPDETVIVTLSNASNATISTATGTGTITNDDATLVVTLSLSPASISENGGVSTVSAKLSHPSSAATTITVRPLANAYTVGQDSTITIAAGDTTNASDTVAITAVDNGQYEVNRAVTVSGVARNDQGVGSVIGAALTLEDDDAPKMYWADYGTDKIQRADLNGSNVEDLISGLNNPFGIALDVGGGKMYWTDYGTNKIQRADLDGSNVEDLISGLSRPYGIALDVRGGKMYWTDSRTSRIQRADLNGSNFENLITTGLRTPWAIALDVGGGKMYWTDSGTDKIQRADLDGSNVEDLITTGLDRPWGLALDVGGGKMYWTDQIPAKIRRADLDGSNVEDLITTGLSGIEAIALDVGGGKMYWTDSGTDKIQRADLNGSNVEDLITTGLDRPWGLALDKPTVTLALSPMSISEAGSVSTVSATLSHLSSDATTITVRPVTGAYTVGSDSTITIAAGDTTNASDTVVITAVNNTTDAPAKRLGVSGTVAGDDVASLASRTLTITDDDAAPDVTLSLSPASISENGGVSTVSATLSRPSSAATTITVRPLLGNTYTVAADSTIVIVAGDTTNASDTVVITAVDNAQDDEPNRIVLVSHWAVNDQGVGGLPYANLTLTDDDDPPTLSIADARVDESDDTETASLEFIVTLSAASGRQVTVEYAETSSGRTATPGVDYTALDSGTLTFAAGVTRDTIAVSVTGDDANEPNETVIVELSNPSNATISTATGTGTITNDDGVPTLSISSPTVTEGSGSSSLEFIVTLSAASGQQVTVDYAETATGRTATPGADYTAITGGTLTFAAGVTRDTLAVSVLADALDEENETVVVELSNAVNATISTATGTGTITDDDATPTLSIASASVAEGTTGATPSLEFIVSLSAVSGRQVTVDYADATSGTASSGTDYTAITGGTLTLAAGVTRDTLAVTVLGDVLDEENETVVVTLSSASNATLTGGVSTLTVTGTITDDDDPPTLSIADASVTEGDAGETPSLEFIVSLSAASGKVVTVDYVDATSGTASSGTDYTAITAGTLTLAAGVTRDTIAVSVTGDDANEPDETVIVTLSNPSNATLTGGVSTLTGTGTITNDDGVPSLSISSPTVAEGSGSSSLEFIVSLNAASGLQVTVDYADAGSGTATSGDDYTAITAGTLTFAAGVTSDTLAVSVTADALDEDDETVIVELSNASNAAISTATGTGTITDDDATPTLSIDSPSVAEGTTGATPSLEFIVSLSAVSGRQVTVAYADATSGTATSGTDYTEITSGTLTLAAGVTSDTLAVTVRGDVLDEDDETVIVTLSSPSNATFTGGNATLTGTGTITDDDDEPTLSIADASVTEGDAGETPSLEFIVSLSAVSGRQVTVGYADATSGTATSGTDYTAITSGTLTFAAGVTRDTIAVTVTGDDANEPDETVVVTLSSPSNATFTGGATTLTGTGTITNDDGVPRLSISSPTVAEGSGSSSLEFVVTLNEASGQQVTVDYADAGSGTATSGDDYTEITAGTLTLAAGVTSDTLAVTVLADALDEDDETVIVELSSPSNAAISTASGTGTITDDDATPTLSIADASVDEGTTGDTPSLEFIVSLSAVSGRQVTVAYADATSGTATSGTDYTEITSGTLTFAAGVTSDTLAVTVRGDALDEDDETVIVTLSSASNATFTGGNATLTGTGTITDDDDEPTLSIADASVTEGDAGETPSLEFIVSLSAASGKVVTVGYADATSGTATSGTDYTALDSGTLTFAAGVTRDTIAVSVTGDDANEPNETVIVTLSSPSNASFTGGGTTLTGTGTIRDDDQIDYDTDNDNLIDVTSLAQLNAIRYDLNGDGAVADSDTMNYNAAFPAAASGMGCPATCTGYELMNNLDFDSDNSGTVDVNDHGGAYWNSGAGWTAIGVDASGAATAFAATFDGNDNTISNLFINSSTSTATGGGYVGLFGNVTGTIRDVGLEDVNITNTRTGASEGRTGALAGRLSSGGTVRGSHVAGGSVTHTTSSTSTGHIGCLLGYSDGTVRDSYATCNVTGTNNYSLNIAGLIGKSDAGGTVDTTYATGTVTSTGTGTGLIAVAGLIGRNEGQVSVSYATGNVSGNGRGGVGGLTGKMAGPSFANYATGNVSGSGTGTGATDVQSLNMGGLTGYIEIGSGEYLRASYATGNVSGSGTGVKAGGLTGRVMVNDANSISAVYAIGAVSSTSTGTTGIGGLAGEQDGSATPMTNSYWDTQTTGQSTTAGTSSSTTGAQTTSALQSITGYTAGSIYADWNLNLDGQAGNDDPWYFGATDQYPVLKYAGLDTTAQFTLQPAIVTLALMPASISENGGVSTVTATLAHPSSAATTITVRPVAGAYTVGADSTIAIAAGQTANASDTVVITAVDNAQDEADRSVTVSGVARNDQGVGSVTGADLTLMDDDGAPTLSISSPSVAEGDDTETASLEFIVTLSAVSGQQVTVGYEDAGSGTATSGTDYTAITAGTLTLAAGVTRDTIAVTVRGDDAIELNETVVVELSNPVNATLTGEVTTLTGTGTITDDDGSGYDTDNDNLIDITTLAQLNAIRYDLDGDGAQGSVSASDWTNYTTAFPNAATGMGCPATCTGYELMNNLDFDTNGSGSVDAGDDYPNWTAIGVDASGAATVFSAIFDGNDNTISNLFINSSTSTATGGSFVGLFGDVSGTIRDVGLLDVNITNTRTATGTNFGRTGALAGKLSAGGTVRGSYIAGGSVTHTTGSGSFGYIGCLLGYSNGTISDSYATCNVVGTNNNVLNLGGLIGESDVSGSVDSTYATGTVTSSGPGSDVVTAGGLIGYSTVRVSVSYATGNVTATGRGRVGGLIGRMGGSSFANYATGNVSGSGTGTGATTIQSLKVGGLMGEINLDGGEYLRASYATGNVSGSGTGVKAGGLTGRVQVNDANSITAVYAIGAVSNTSTGTTATGGLAGEQGGSATPMTNSYWDTQTTGQTTTAGTSSSTTGAQTTSALQSITGYTVGSIYADWNLNLDGQAGNDDPWNFGATNQYPVLKYAGLDATAQFTLQPAVVTLALMPASISENGGVSTVTATLAYPSSAATTITVRPVAGAYAVGADSTIAIAAGQTANASDTVVITAVDNAQDELDRSVTVSGMARNDQGVGSVTGADLTLTDDEDAPTVTMAVAPASISENVAISTVTATLSHPSSAATTITVSVTPVQPAVAGDYTLSTADTLIVAAGQTTSTGTVTITTVDNAVTSGNKTVTVSSTVGNSVGAGSVTDATLTIIDDEAAQVTLVLSPASISENAEVSTITATLDRTVAVATTITVSAEAVSPAEASDFTLSGATTLTIAANVATSTGTVTITAVNNTTDAPDKRVTVSATVAGGDGASLSSAMTLTITDDDEAPDVTLVLTPSSISENAEVSTVSATLSHPSSAITTITVSAEAVSPATASDFTLSSADTLIIAASETTSTGTVTITAADNDARADEKTVTVSATANNTQGITDPSDVTLTITDDETPSANLDVDGDGRVRLFSDIILVIRYVLFFREEALLRGNVIEQQATRTTAQQIEPYLDILVNQNILDVDGDGDVRLFSDIILIIRYVLFFREDALVRGNVIEQQATRTTAQEIEPFIRSLYPDSHFE